MRIRKNDFSIIAKFKIKLIAMRIEADTPEEYIEQLPIDRQEVITKLRALINRKIPPKFEEQMNYGFISWVIPHSVYPDGNIVIQKLRYHF